MSHSPPSGTSGPSAPSERRPRRVLGRGASFGYRIQLGFRTLGLSSNKVRAAAIAQQNGRHAYVVHERWSAADLAAVRAAEIYGITLRQFPRSRP